MARIRWCRAVPCARSAELAQSLHELEMLGVPAEQRLAVRVERDPAPGGLVRGRGGRLVAATARLAQPDRLDGDQLDLCECEKRWRGACDDARVVDGDDRGRAEH